MSDPAQRPTPATPPPGRRRARSRSVDPNALVWDHPIRLVTNPFMLWDMARVLAAAVLLMQLAVFIVSFFFIDEIVWLPVEMMLLTLGVIAGLYLVVSLVIFRNGIDTRFAVDSQGARMETSYGDDAYEKGVGWVLRGLLFIVNPLAGLTTSLPGLAASSDGIAWREITRVTVHRRLGVVSLAEGWRTALRLYCDPRSIDMLADTVRAHAAPAIARKSRLRETDAPRRSIVFYLAWTAVALAAGVASMAWYWAADDVLRPMVAAVALVGLAGWSLPAWWTRLLAWPGLAVCLLLMVKLGVPAVESRPSVFGGVRRAFETDTAELVIAAAGCGVLLAMCLYLVWHTSPRNRGRRQVNARGSIKPASGVSPD